MTIQATLFVGMSVDGFIARRDGGLDFLDVSDGSEEKRVQPDHGFAEFLASVDALVMGRRTYEVVVSVP